MAIYQHHIIFLPKENRNEIPLRTDELFDETINLFWKGRNASFNEIESKLNSFANPIEWSKDIVDFKNYGDSETNDISIWLDGNKNILEFSCRFDLRKLDFEFVENTLGFAQHFDCLGLDSKGNLFEPYLDKLIENLEKSEAFKFMLNPKEFLAKLAEKRT